MTRAIRQKAIRCILPGMIFLGAAAPAVSQSQPEVSARDRRAIRAEITPELRLAVRRGLSQMVRLQRKTKSFKSEDYPVAANALMVAGLARLGESARRIWAGHGRRAVAHATSGPCLQQNLVCVLEGD